ncbi:DNA mismatch repair endonuclease MutL [Blattabacterium cuenoti]|uniref:DNA mismatch repair endonuclease MutL n=1 Tax=Blattabacterium cuenoti TaxID=1653831 RepID=UPI00163D1333|nr:DNA mismatch repair endonuclease MutL [Blattabacterium cuenoti]
MKKDVINFLPIKVINQIAAGEVIQRPSSILKELLENSIDANARVIDVFIKDSGKTLIQLIDDGDGMSKNDARMSIERYTTSKIKKHDDIFKISTKGFRGEALASIALISQLEIQTKNEKDSVGIHLFIEEGKIKNEIPINMLKGTRISVKNIFYKLPVRRRFLKSSRIEFQNIVYEFYKIILAHRNILYRFYHNNKIIFSFQEVSLIERIKEIFNNKKKVLKPILINKNEIFIEGFVSVPDSSIKKGNHLILVNQRCVKYLFLHRKIIHSYNGFLKNFETISYFIFIYVPPSLVNCNIHPSKKEVKLKGEEIVGSIIQQEIKNVLFRQYNVKKKELKNYNIFLDPNLENSFLNNSCFKNPSYKKEKQSINWFELNDYSLNEGLNKNSDLIIKLSNYVSNKEKIKVFQINKKYIIFKFDNESTILVDQYRAHKNILVEFFSGRKKLMSQLFFFPIKIKLFGKEFLSLKNIKNDLIDLGFHLYFFNESVYLYSIPEMIHQNTLIEIFKNILKYNFIKGEKNNKIILIKLISESASIKYGTRLLSNEMVCLIKNLFSCNNPSYTDSGDPIIFFLKTNFSKSEFSYKS